MLRKIIISILFIVFGFLFYLILNTKSLWRKIVFVLLTLLLFCGCVIGYVSDRNSAYYGNSIFEHHVLPFELQIVNGYNHDLGHKVYKFGWFGEAFTDEQYITIQTDDYTPNQYICMQTILSYGYNKKEMVVHWLGCDSVDYYVRVDSPEWCYIFPSQLISKEDIKAEDYQWISLVK